jgi:hypothetical protein
MNENETPKEKEKKIDYSVLCPQLRSEFFECTKKWYFTEFLKAKKVENSCTEEWYDFRSCLLLQSQEKIKKN